MSKLYRWIAIAAAFCFFCGLFFYSGPATAQEGPLKLIAPNGGEKYVIGSMIDILWSAKMVQGFVDILLKKNDWIVGEIANSVPAASGKFTWKAGMVKIGLAGPSDMYKISIRTSDGKYQDESDAHFSILATALPSKTSQPGSPAGERPRLAIAKPDNGTRWCFDKENIIQWSGNLPASVNLKIELLDQKGNPLQTIAADLPVYESFRWTVPVDLQAGVYPIKVSTIDNRYAAEESFMISDTP